MSRKRAPENQYICIRCGCACTHPDDRNPRHLGGGSRGMRACGKPPHSRLRRDWEAEIARDVACLREIIDGDRLGPVDLDLDR